MTSSSPVCSTVHRLLQKCNSGSRHDAFLWLLLIKRVYMLHQPIFQAGNVQGSGNRDNQGNGHKGSRGARTHRGKAMTVGESRKELASNRAMFTQVFLWASPTRRFYI